MLRRRLALLAAVPLAALAFSACGAEEVVTEAGTEGIWVDAGSVDYQVQGSRLLEEGNQVPDDTYLKGVAEGITSPNDNEVWFAVWVRAENRTEKTVPSAKTFQIEDTLGSVFKPVAIDTEANPYAYKPKNLTPEEVIPFADSAQFLSSTQGAELLFKIPLSSYQNRPLQFTIFGADAGGPAHATIDLDV